MNKYKLVLAEKPSVAKSIAAVLHATKREDGYFIGESGYIISWCMGHLLQQAPPEVYGDYAKWRQNDLPIIPKDWRHNPLKGKAAQLNIIKALMHRADVECIINACDAGREGENIFRLVYAYCQCNKPVKRLWISSMEDTAIRTGFDTLKDGTAYDNLAAAAFCRESADWMVGINCTRLFTVLYGGKTLNVGRVQSPTLAMLVKRDAEIAGFVKEPFYMPTIQFDSFTATGARQTDRAAAQAVRDACNGKTVTLRSVRSQNKSEAPPKLFDLTALQREANRLLGYTAAQTLEYAQNLYERKILSYPRVDSRYLTTDMSGTAAEMAAWLQQNLPFEAELSFAPDIARLLNDSKVSDHHAIIPTAELFTADRSALPVGERELLHLVMVRTLAATAPAHTYEAVEMVFDCADHSFTAKGKTVLSDGWCRIESAYRTSLKSNREDEKTAHALPELTEGQTFDGVSVSVQEGMTTPPKPYTEATLLSAMENAGQRDVSEGVVRRGLGTPATRAAIIEKLIKTGFAERNKKNLVATESGKSLIAVLPDVLTSPLLTSDWETKLCQVEQGELSAAAFMEEIAGFVRNIVNENAAPNPEHMALFGDKRAESEALGTCPRCGAPVREAEKGFFCDSASCGFKLWKNAWFWKAKKKPLTAAIVTVLLKDGRVALKNLHSEKTGKTYDATIVLDDCGGQFVGFKMEF